MKKHVFQACPSASGNFLAWALSLPVFMFLYSNFLFHKDPIGWRVSSSPQYGLILTNHIFNDYFQINSRSEVLGIWTSTWGGTIQPSTMVKLGIRAHSFFGQSGHPQHTLEVLTLEREMVYIVSVKGSRGEAILNLSCFLATWIILLNLIEIPNKIMRSTLLQKLPFLNQYQEV